MDEEMEFGTYTVAYSIQPRVVELNFEILLHRLAFRKPSRQKAINIWI